MCTQKHFRPNRERKKSKNAKRIWGTSHVRRPRYQLGPKTGWRLACRTDDDKKKFWLEHPHLFWLFFPRFYIHLQNIKCRPFSPRENFFLGLETAKSGHTRQNIIHHSRFFTLLNCNIFHSLLLAFFSFPFLCLLCQENKDTDGCFCGTGESRTERFRVH